MFGLLRRNRKAYTLIELIAVIAFAITGVVILGVIVFGGIVGCTFCKSIGDL